MSRTGRGFEPRRRKRRPPLYGYLHLPRHEAQLAMLKGTNKNYAIRLSVLGRLESSLCEVLANTDADIP